MIHKHKWGEVEEVECGCQLVRCGICGVGLSQQKCPLHKPKKHDSQFYYQQELHGSREGIPRHTKVAAELELALQDMDFGIPWGDAAPAIDIGAGIGIYAPLLMSKGYRYEALELDRWACHYIKGAYSPHTHNIKFCQLKEAYSWQLILAAHVLEHLKESDRSLEKMFRILRPGGLLYIIIPDDSDIGNPDHLWFFKEETMRQWMEECGFVDIRATQKQIVVWEKFMYFVGRKPE